MPDGTSPEITWRCCTHWQLLLCILPVLKGVMNVDPEERETELQSLFSLSFTATADIFNILSASCLQCGWWMFWFSALEKKGINGEKQLLQLENHWGLECFEWCFSLTMAKLPEQVQKIAAVLRNNPHLINNLISLKALPKNVFDNGSYRNKMMTR